MSHKYVRIRNLIVRNKNFIREVKILDFATIFQLLY